MFPLKIANLLRHRDKLPVVFFVAALCVFSFVYGALVVGLEIFPYGVINRGYAELVQLTKSRGSDIYLHPSRYDVSGAVIHDREQTYPGSTLLTGHWMGDRSIPGIRLIDIDGNVLNHWEVSPSEIWPQSPHDDWTRNSMNADWNNIHGTYLFPDGDVLLSVEFLGLMRMDSCGEILWNLPYRTHHSIDRADDGNFWVLGMRWVEEGDERAAAFAGLTVPFMDDTVLEVSPEGEILTEFSVLESVYNSEYRHLLWNRSILEGDILHSNDVEILGEELAEQFPMFDAGDLVYSSNHLSLLAVLSQDGEIKWVSTGDFTNQHDPDFEENGLITVLDNRTDIPSEDSDVGASMIRSIDPANQEVRAVYPAGGTGHFYTAFAGKHQKLPNGNRLITEATAGRVFEVTPEGETVWEWVSDTFDGDLVPEVLEGTRYDISPQQVAGWQCSGPP